MNMTEDSSPCLHNLLTPKRSQIAVQEEEIPNQLYPKCKMLDAIYKKKSEAEINGECFHDIDTQKNDFALQKQGQEVNGYRQNVCNYRQQQNHTRCANNNYRTVIQVSRLEIQREKKIQEFLQCKPGIVNTQYFKNSLNQVQILSKQINVMFPFFKDKSIKDQIGFHLSQQSCLQFNTRVKQKQIKEKRILQLIHVFKVVLSKNVNQIRKLFKDYTEQIKKLCQIPKISLEQLGQQWNRIEIYLFLFKYLHVTSKSSLEEFQLDIKSHRLQNSFFESLSTVIGKQLHQPRNEQYGKNSLYSILQGFHKDYKQRVKIYAQFLKLQDKIKDKHIANNTHFVKYITSIKAKLPFFHYVNFLDAILIPKQEYPITHYFTEDRFSKEPIKILKILLKIQDYFLRDNHDCSQIDQFCSKYILSMKNMIINFKVTRYGSSNCQRITYLYDLSVFLKEQKNRLLWKKMKQVMNLLQEKLIELYLFINQKRKIPQIRAELDIFSSFLQAYHTSDPTNDLQESYRRNILEVQSPPRFMTHL